MTYLVQARGAAVTSAQETFGSLMLRVEDMIGKAEENGDTFYGVHVAEMGDGSGRMFALIDFMREGEEFQVRITAPAPLNAPAWAEKFTDYETTEISARNSNLSQVW